MNEDWTKEEVKLIVADYFDMFILERNSEHYNKSAHRKNLAPKLNNRDNSIEYKHRNISGVLAEMGQPYIKGYKPLFNYQQLLADEVVRLLDNNKSILEQAFKSFVAEKVELPLKKINFEKALDETITKSKKIIEREPFFLPIKPNYLAQEQNNRQLGEKGEEFVVDYERWRLIREGKHNLADKIEWVSKEKGDGMGYDILSKNNNGTDRFIEVKTTKLCKETPIYLSRNELRFASLKVKDFFLYRVFNFNESPRISIKQGEYESFCQLQPQTFRGFF
jgi:uncharacterized protein DUF3883